MNIIKTIGDWSIEDSRQSLFIHHCVPYGSFCVGYERNYKTECLNCDAIMPEEIKNILYPIHLLLETDYYR